jgi:hypothetical protein
MPWEIQLLQEFLECMRSQEQIDLTDKDLPNYETIFKISNF